MAIGHPRTTSYGPEIPAFCLVFGALTLYILDSINGNLCSIGKYVLSRDWALIKHADKYTNAYKIYFSFIIGIMIFLCPIAFFVWAAVLFYNEDYYDGAIMTPIAVVTVGVCVIAFALAFFILRWNLYRLTWKSLGLFLISIASFIGYQMCGNFLGDIEYSFFGISAVFLSCNAIVFIFIVFLNDGKNATNFLALVSDKLDFKHEDDEAEDQLLKYYQTRDKKINPDYCVTQKEIDYFFTIREEDRTLVTGGVIMRYGSLPTVAQVFITFFLYVFSVGILVGYSYIIYETTSEYKLGFITMIAVITTDTIIYLFYYIKVSQSTFQLCFMAIVFRICLVGFGGDYWFYGYCLLYALLGIIVSLNIAAKHFPIKTTVYPVENTLTVSGKTFSDLMKTPEFLILYATAMFAIITVCLVVTEPDGAPLPALESSERDYPFWCMSLLAFGIVVFSYLVIAITRMLLRKKQQMEDDVHYYFFHNFCDVFWIHVYLCYAVLVIAGFVGYGLADDPTYLVCACFLPMAAIMLLHAYLNYSANDYRVLKDIPAENRRRQTAKIAKEKSYLAKSQDFRMGTLTKVILKPSDVPPEVDRELKHCRTEVKKEESSGKDSEDTKRDENTKIKESGRNREASSSVYPLGSKENLMEEDEFQMLDDWTEDHNFFTAFWKGKLHSNDYQLIFGFIGALLMIFFNSMTLQLKNDYDDSYYGVTLGIILLDSLLVLAGCFNFLSTDINFGVLNIVVLVLGLAIHVLYGVLYFVVREELDLDVNGNMVWIWFYVVFAPMFLALTMGFYKLYRRKWGMNAFTVVMAVLCIVLGAAFAVLTWDRYGWVTGTIVTVVVVLFAYALVFFCLYASNNYSMTYTLYVTNIVLFCILACAAMIASWGVSGFEPFVGFSVTYGIIVMSGFFLFLVKLAKMCLNFHSAPFFVSPYVFPIYKYSATRKTASKSNLTVFGLYAFIILIIAWGVIFSIYFRPMHYGISVTCLGTVAFGFLTFFLIVYTPSRTEAYRDWMGKAIFTDAWLASKNSYIENNKVKALDKLVTCRSLAAAHEAVNERNEEWTEVRLSAYTVKKVEMGELSAQQQKSLLNEIEERMKEQYHEELALVIEFEVMALLGAVNMEESYRRKMLKFTEEKREVLERFGIDFDMKGVSGQKLKFTVIMNQVSKMLPKQKLEFTELFKQYEAEQEKKRLEELKQEEEEEQKRKALLEVRSKPKVDLEHEKTLPIEQMADTPLKYQKIKALHDEQRAAGRLYKYEDNKFTRDISSLGQRLSSFNTWREANPKGEEVNVMELYGSEDFVSSVRQGSLGDCYFLSALTVIGEERVKECILTKPEEISTGAYCVRFFSDSGEEEHVIVDDYFPVDSTGQWAFVRSESEKELWPMILEKAYAKLFGTYENIEAGKVCYALADLTGGVPEQVKLEEESRDFDGFCRKIFAYHGAGYLMGAGSTASIFGDSVAVNGIVQGHAYSVLRLAEFQDEKLIQLRNPHGSSGVEWDGDWSDGSRMWTEAAKVALNYDNTNQKNGIFWMSLMDFLFNFDNLYICRIFDKSWTRESDHGKWTAANTPGLPSETNANPKLERNPHYLISVTRPCTIFVELTQCKTVSMFQGEQSIYFFIANNNGERIKNTTRDIRVCSSYPPTNLITVSKELIVDNNFFYPLTLTLMVCTEEAGVEEDYILKVYTTDPYFTFTKMK